MTVWNYMAGRLGLHEEYVLGNERIHMNYNLNRSALNFRDRDEIEGFLIVNKTPGYMTPENTAKQDARNLWRFSRIADRGDIVVMRRRPTTSRTVAIAQIGGNYTFDPDLSAGENQPGPHYRCVNWIARTVPMDQFGLGPNWPPPARLTFSRTLRNVDEADGIVLETVNQWLAGRATHH